MVLSSCPRLGPSIVLGVVDAAAAAADAADAAAAAAAAADADVIDISPHVRVIGAL